MNKKIVFMGTPIFACAILEQLIKDQYDVIAVVTQPDKKVGRKRELTPVPVKVKAMTYGIPVYQFEQIKDNVETITALNPDMIVTCAYGQMVPQDILDVPKYGCINIHASLLPKLRGGAPIHKAIIEGHTKTGISIMQMIKKMDAGDVYAQAEVTIEPDDTLGSLHDKLMACGAALMSQTLPLIFSNTLKAVPQDSSHVSFAYNITRAEERINWNDKATHIDCLVRGLNPAPGSYTRLGGRIVKVWALHVHACANAQSHHAHQSNGTIVKHFKTGIAVKVVDGVVVITQLQLEGKKQVAVEELLKGQHPFQVGEVFESI